MVQSSRKSLLAATGASLAAAAVGIAVAVSGANAESKSAAGSPIQRSTPVAAKQQNPEADPNMYPFGAPKGSGDYKVPPPPEAPTLVPTIGTKTTQRLYGANPFQEAVSVTQHIWTAAVPENNPAENNNDPDRPWGVTLITPDAPLTAITATPLIHFPDDAPILFVTKSGIPRITLNELKRLGDTGISRFKNVDAFLVGPAANDGVKAQLKA